MRFVEGVTFRDLKRGGDADAIAEAAWSVGETLAAVGRTVFPSPGWLGPRLALGPPLPAGDHAIPRLVDMRLESINLQRRMPPELRARVRHRMCSRSAQLASLGTETRLVHGDFNRRNVIVRRSQGRRSVAAILDWEFAIAGSPLTDVANFLRYEREMRPLAVPHFSAATWMREADCRTTGAVLRVPSNWPPCARA
jgi:hypothetical protein